MTIEPESVRSGESSFGKGLRVLGWVLDHDASRVDEVAEGVGLPLSSAYRFLRTLREQEFVSDADSDGRYQAGSRLRGGTSLLPTARIAALALPFLEHLAEATGETAVLTVRHGLNAICLRQVESAHQIRLAFRTGQLLPLYAGAGQRALLAFAPDEVVRGVASSALRAFTPDTPSREELNRMIANTRRDGFALSRGELTPGSVAIAVPVRRGRDVVCALCVAGTRNRCHSAWQRAARQELDWAARSLADAIGPAGTV